MGFHPYDVFVTYIATNMEWEGPKVNIDGVL